MEYHLCKRCLCLKSNEQKNFFHYKLMPDDERICKDCLTDEEIVHIYQQNRYNVKHKGARRYYHCGCGSVILAETVRNHKLLSLKHAKWLDSRN